MLSFQLFQVVAEVIRQMDYLEPHLPPNITAIPFAPNYEEVEELMPPEIEEIEAIQRAHHRLEKVPEQKTKETKTTSEKAKVIYPILITLGCFVTFSCVARLCYFRWKKKKQSLV